jgi:anthranilate synthase component 1
MQIIDKLEPTKRGPYAGVVGYLDSPATSTPRSRSGPWCGGRPGHAPAGAGIVADSDAADEDLECRNKARALLTAAAAARLLPPLSAPDDSEEP